MHQPSPSSPTEQSSALSRVIVGVVARATGRGPTKVRVTIGHDIISVVLRENHTSGERTLVSSGDHAAVADFRRAHHQAMQADLIQAAQEATGREVQGMLADHDPVLDVSILNFVLVPSPTAARAVERAATRVIEDAVVGDDASRPETPAPTADGL